MKLFGLLSRGVVLIGLGLAAGTATTPVHAGTAEIGLLKTYIGSWKGRGTIKGSDSETVVCKLNVTEGNSDKLNYAGRCTLAGTQLSVNGTIAYIDKSRRYEAAMTSNVTFSGIAVGKRQGDGVVFNLREQDKDEEGNEMTITSQIALIGGKIDVEFLVIFNATGDTLRAVVPFSK